jgi:hypothetical protein
MSVTLQNEEFFRSLSSFKSRTRLESYSTASLGHGGRERIMTQREEARILQSHSRNKTRS